MSFKSFIKKHFVRNKVLPVPIPIVKGEMLANKVALIFGGSGGIGSEIAKVFTDNGCIVCVVGTRENELKQICESISPKKAEYIIANIKKVNEITYAINKAIELFGKIDIFVHAAGVHCHDAFGDISEKTWNDVMDVNLKSLYFSCQSISSYMIKNRVLGNILIVGSASGTKPGWTPYEISKAGVKSLTLGFADKLIKYGITVNGIAPGPVATPMLGKEKGTDDLCWQGNPTGRMCDPKEIANWALILCCEIGKMVVGDLVYVSGGSGLICIDK